MEPTETKITTYSKITAERIRELFDYDPDDGMFWRRVNYGKYGKAGKVLCSDPLEVDGERHKLSRYIWLHYYGEWPGPDLEIDHINRDPWDNRIGNLRLATRSENMYNSMRGDPSGYKGTARTYRKEKPWKAQIRVDGVRFYLGSFETREEAATAYKEALHYYHGDFKNLEGTISHDITSEASEQ